MVVRACQAHRTVWSLCPFGWRDYTIPGRLRVLEGRVAIGNLNGGYCRLNGYCRPFRYEIEWLAPQGST